MLNDAHAEAIVPVSDLERATRFYEGTLGLTVLQRVEDAPSVRMARFRLGGGGFLAIYESVGAGQSRHTVASFVVDDIESVVSQLRERGLTFEEYDMAEIKTVDGIATVDGVRGAWFRDPDGNIVGIGQYS